MAEHAPTEVERGGPTLPILAPSGASPATASRPEEKLDGAYHIYESNPVPWWVALLWLSFFLFALGYLLLNLIG
jgi:hypothetical protein